MGIIDWLTNKIDKRVNPEEYNLGVVERARQEIMSAYGPDNSGLWIDAYEWRFNSLINDPQNNYLEKLGDKKMHGSVIEEIKQKLYN